MVQFSYAQIYEISLDGTLALEHSVPLYMLPMFPPRSCVFGYLVAYRGHRPSKYMMILVFLFWPQFNSRFAKVNEWRKEKKTSVSTLATRRTGASMDGIRFPEAVGSSAT